MSQSFSLRTLKPADVHIFHSVATTGHPDPDEVLPCRHGEGSGKFSVEVSQPAGLFFFLYLCAIISQFPGRGCSPTQDRGSCPLVGPTNSQRLERHNGDVESGLGVSSRGQRALADGQLFGKLLSSCFFSACCFLPALSASSPEEEAGSVNPGHCTISLALSWAL